MDVSFKQENEIAELTDNETAELAEILAKAFHKLLIQNLKNNKFGYVLRESTLTRRKYSKITSLKPLIGSGDYLTQIQQSGGSVFIANGATKRGFDFQQLGDLLEYGRVDKNFGGFPHWRPTLQEFIPHMERIIVGYYTGHIVKRKR